jgi:Flp pilus assembly protein TadD
MIPAVNPKHEMIALVNKGLLAVAQNDYTEAFNLFQKAHELDKNNVMVSTCVWIERQ